jgi:type I restriction enzyme S subunit
MSFPRYRKYKDSGVEWLGEVPEHWDIGPIKRHISKVESGTSVNSADEPAENGKLGVLKTSCVYTGVFKPEENKTVVEDDLARVSCPLKAGTIIVSRMNTPELIGAAGFVEAAPGNLFLPDRLWQISFANSDPRFVHFWTLTNLYRAQVESVCTGTSASMKNLGQDQFGMFNFASPPINEQSRIAEFLDRETGKIDELVAEQQRLMELLKEKRQAVISHAVTKGLNPRAPMKPSGIEWLGDVPAHWDVMRLKFAMTLTPGFAFSSGDFVDEGIQLIRIGNLYLNELSLDRDPVFLPPAFESTYADFVVTSGDLLMSLTGTLGKKDYGYAVLLRSPEKHLLNQRVGRLQCRNNINQSYAELLLQSDLYTEQIHRLPFGTKQANLASDDVLGAWIVLPPSTEQREIGTYLEQETHDCETLSAEAQKAIDLLQERRTALISAAVTGQIDVRKLAAA